MSDVPRETIPAELLAIARQARDIFGAKVKLKFAADDATGQTWGNPGYDLAQEVPSVLVESAPP